MFPPENVHEHERLGKLFGLDKKSRAINLPLTAGLHWLPPLGEVVGDQLTSFDLRLTIFLSYQVLPAGFCLTRELECTRGIGGGQFHKFGAVREKSVADFARWHECKKCGVSRANSHHHAAFVVEKSIREESVKRASRNFHTGRTGNAENRLVATNTSSKVLVPAS